MSRQTGMSIHPPPTYEVHDMDHVRHILAQWQQQRPGLDTGPMGLIGRFKIITRLLEQELEKCVQEYGLNLSSFDLLATLLRAGKPHQLSPSVLSQNTMVTSGTTTNRIDQLVKVKWVERVKNPNDGRSVLIALTQSGKEVIETALEAHLDNLSDLTSCLTTEQFTELDSLLSLYLSTLYRREEEAHI